jgi:hypothetical protein
LAAAQVAIETDRAGFDDFRNITRAIFRDDPVAQNALSATGRLLDDREKFQMAAAAAYAAALGHNAYLTVLGKRSFDRATLRSSWANRPHSPRPTQHPRPLRPRPNAPSSSATRPPKPWMTGEPNSAW